MARWLGTIMFFIFVSFGHSYTIYTFRMVIMNPVIVIRISCFNAVYGT